MKKLAMLVMESNTGEEALQYLQKNDAGDHLNLGVVLGGEVVQKFLGKESQELIVKAIGEQQGEMLGILYNEF
mgnify:CR=1 FL=1